MRCLSPPSWIPILGILLIMQSCMPEQKEDKIRLGMQLDEVEKELGRKLELDEAAIDYLPPGPSEKERQIDPVYSAEIKRTRELDSDQQVIRETFYQFNSHKQLVEIIEVTTRAIPEIEYRPISK